MKTYKRFNLSRKFVDADTYLAACRVAGTDPRADELTIECKDGDDRAADLIDRLVATCQTGGYRPHPDGGYGAGTFSFEITRKYDDSDFASASLLRVWFGKLIPYGSSRDASGVLHIFASSFLDSLEMAWADCGSLVVSEAEMRRMEEQGLKGLSFRLIQVDYKPEVEKKAKAIVPLWEIYSDIVLPKARNLEHFVHAGINGSTPFSVDYSRPIWLKDRPYRNGELQYRRSDLSAVGPFDAARTFEMLNMPRPALVLSPRFYRYCKERNHGVTYQPVRVVD